MNIFAKFKETVGSVLPVMAIVFLLGFFVVPLDRILLARFVIGGLFLIFGLTVFLMGVDIGIQPMGERCGAALTQRRSLLLLLVSAFAIGFLITIAEPDIQVFGSQVNGVFSYLNKNIFIFVIAAGVGLFIMLGLLRTVMQFPLKVVLIISYGLLFAMALFVPPEFVGIAFDSGGATTGPMTVPFIMALGLGVSSVRSTGSKDSFGLTGVTSIGPVIAVILYAFFFKNGGSGSSEFDVVQQEVMMETVSLNPFASVFIPFGIEFPAVAKEAASSILPVVILFCIFQIFLLKMTARQVVRMVIGIVYSFLGLTVFLLGVNVGFMPAGLSIGQLLGQNASDFGGFWFYFLIATGFVFGAIVVCAEPAVWVLTEQVEQVSGGTIKRKVLLMFLSVGAAFAIGLSLWRAVAGFDIKYILIPGYAIAFILMFFCPDLFTGIAFDSGGVASGPITSTFVLSFTLGASASAAGNNDAFGVIALVAMMPLIAIQFLGILYEAHRKRAEKLQVARQSCSVEEKE